MQTFTFSLPCCRLHILCLIYSSMPSRVFLLSRGGFGPYIKIDNTAEDEETGSILVPGFLQVFYYYFNIKIHLIKCWKCNKCVFFYPLQWVNLPNQKIRTITSQNGNRSLMLKLWISIQSRAILLFTPAIELEIL